MITDVEGFFRWGIGSEFRMQKGLIKKKKRLQKGLKGEKLWGLRLPKKRIDRTSDNQCGVREVVCEEAWSTTRSR